MHLGRWILGYFGGNFGNGDVMEKFVCFLPESTGNGRDKVVYLKTIRRRVRNERRITERERV